MTPRLRLGTAAIAVLLVGGCRTADSSFPATGSLFGSVAMTNVSVDSSRVLAPREFRFRIRSFEADLSDQTSWSFLGAGRSPCTFVFTVTSLIDSVPATELTRQCGGGGLVLDAGKAGTVAFVLNLDAINAIIAERPDLATGRDWDGDGVPNESDNCPIQYNPRVPVDPGDPTAGERQPDGNSDGVGDACSYPLEGSTEPTIPDQDLDGVFDGIDNCLWYPNPADSEGVQGDSNRNGIGDACERTIPVVIGGSGGIVCPALAGDPVPYEIPESGRAFYSMDFSAAIRCDPAFTACDLDPSAVTLVGRSGLPPGVDEIRAACEALP
jgi:hypothetical protein